MLKFHSKRISFLTFQEARNYTSTPSSDQAALNKQLIEEAFNEYDAARVQNENA
jgi:hypothetical protein